MEKFNVGYKTDIMKLEYIVLVDDSPAVNYYNKLLIEKTEICSQVFTFTNAKKALTFVLNPEHKEKIDLLLLDINMPEITGIDFLRAFNKETSFNDKRPIIAMLTQGINTRNYSITKDNLGANEYINKPLDLEDIEDIKYEYFSNKNSFKVS